ncbi:MAG: hypothetical protein ACREQQ_09175 [Candidatus Binatia bacterium]
MLPQDIDLRVCSVPKHSTYAFTCPSCRVRITKSASDGRVVRLLNSVGVPSEYWSLPDELNEEHDGPPFTADDLIDLMLLLDRPDWSVRLAAVSSRR